MLHTLLQSVYRQVGTEAFILVQAVEHMGINIQEYLRLAKFGLGYKWCQIKTFKLELQQR